MSKTKIDMKIVGYAVKQPTVKRPQSQKPESPRDAQGGAKAEVIRMHEKLERPEMLVGSTYKVKTPVSDHAMYVTINDIVLNEGTEYEKRRPFEIFINSKNLDHYQWIVALTRIISAVFRKGGDVTFLVDELKAVFDPRGGYWKPGGKFMPSIIAELGYIVERHLISIGLLEPSAPDAKQQKLIDRKRAEYEASARQQDAFSNSEFPEGAQLCVKCNTAAVVVLDGCTTCLNCGESKCG
ncbi:MAG TPA: NrdJb [Woeseiaceae bacterium]|nr:NrdJb [Woeseiaceae bacterium]